MEQYESNRKTTRDGELSSGKPQVPQLHHQLVGFKRLVGACKQKDLEGIRTILNEQPELINQRDRYNRNLLHYTVILFKRQQRNQADPGGSNPLVGAETGENHDDERRQIGEMLACFNYLLDRCHQKLWWQQDSDGLSLLHLAVISSNNPLVKFIVYEHPYSGRYPLVSVADNERHTPLHWAVITNNPECVRLLVGSAAGAKLIHEPDFNGATALHYATQTNDYPKYRRQLRLMLQNVAASADDDRSADQTKHKRQTFSEHSSSELSLDQQFANGKQQASLEVLEMLVRCPQVNLECRDKDRRTPLLWAASSGNREAVLLLVGAGANPQSCDLNRLGALHCAASHGFTECLESLLGVAKRGSSTSGSLAGERAINQPDNLNCTPIFYAVLSGNIDCVELLADRGASLDWQDSKGRSAAHFAALKGQLQSLKLLRRRGANLWLPNRQGDLPLHYAIKGGRHQVARWLLDHSPYENSVNAINNFGRAPIHLAIQRRDTEMLDHLIGCGANLNQLVRVRDRQRSKRPGAAEPAVEGATQLDGGEFHYETALDMAKRLGQDAGVRQLVESGAQAAAQVMSGRLRAAGDAGASARSLFELHSVEGPSPIGFDTSGSSVAASPQYPDGSPAAKKGASGLPQLSRPRPDSLAQSDSSAGSSALSQNSLTSIRGFPARPTPAHRQTIGDQRRNNHHHRFEADATPGGESKPVRGGISYNNELINASIKCKLYDGQRSFPPIAARTADLDKENRAQMRHQSAPNCGGQEIVTNVNVYTSPCPLAHHSRGCAKCCPSKDCCPRADFASAAEDESATSEGPTSEEPTSCDEATEEPATRAPVSQLGKTHRGPPFGSNQHQQQQQLHQLSSRLPPSQSHEHHLPVILSDREEATTSGGETSNDRSPEVAAGLEPLCGAARNYSPALEEPRFDRSQRAATNGQAHLARHQARSPAADHRSSTNPAPVQSHGYESHHLPDFSQIKPKVDSHRSRSLPRQAADQDGQQTGGQLASRSVSRQTFIRDEQPHRTSQDGLEMELALERSIRKYKQERRLFEELQGLKRSQIRSGRANEAVLVKRLVEHLRREQLAGSNDLLGLDSYSGPYTYRSYERFLYDQLRKLSQSNCAKLSRSMRDFEQELLADGSALLTDSTHDHEAELDAEQHRKFMEEDRQADLELRRLIEGDSGAETGVETEEPPRGSTDEQQQAVGQAEGDSEQTEERPGGLGQEQLVRRSSIVSIGSLSRKSSLEVEAERLKSVTLGSSEHVGAHQQAVDDAVDTKSLIEDEAESICSAIMVDALGNLTSRSPISASSDPSADSDKEQGNSGEDGSSTPPLSPTPPETACAQPRSRRRSVVNIGNKLEVIYHDVGIEIDPVEDPPAAMDESNEQHQGYVDQENRQQPQAERSPKGPASNGPQTMEDVKEVEEEESKSAGDTEIAGRDNLASSQKVELAGEPQLEASGAGSEMTTGESSLQFMKPDTLRAQTAVRRASSPPGDFERPKTQRNRMGSIDSCTGLSSHVSEIRKVFNGYDLDELHQRRVHRVAVAERTTDDGALGGVSQKLAPRKTDRAHPPTRRAKRMRSRLPKRRFRPQVDVDSIKQRWSRVKAIERRRRVNENRGSLEQVSYFASSQPNLEQAHGGQQQPSQWSEPTERSSVVEPERQNYKLLYEINPGFKGRKDSERRDDIWCQRRVARIVDVRSLKRTLSLPESVMYSNDLLKRFNILKL